MKTLALFLLFVSFNSFADFNCVNPQEPDLTYTFSEIKSGDYELRIFQRITDDLSCRTRWGCETSLKVIYFEKLEFRDVQGVLEFKGKRTYVTMDETVKADYFYDGLNRAGQRITKSAQLICEN